MKARFARLGKALVIGLPLTGKNKEDLLSFTAVFSAITQNISFSEIANIKELTRKSIEEHNIEELAFITNLNVIPRKVFERLPDLKETAKSTLLIPSP